jgi:hypothetical protein
VIGYRSACVLCDKSHAVAMCSIEIVANFDAFSKRVFQFPMRACFEFEGDPAMPQMLLISLSIALLVSTLIPTLRDPTEPKKLSSEPRGLKVIYPRPIAPLSRK